MSKKGVLRVLQGGLVAFMCPGCKELHQVNVGNGPGPAWGFNGDYDKPTFTPSILVRGMKKDIRDGEWTGEWIFNSDGDPVQQVCHSFVANGQIQFLGDCTHELAGQTVTLEKSDQD